MNLLRHTAARCSLYPHAQATKLPFSLSAPVVLPAKELRTAAPGTLVSQPKTRVLQTWAAQPEAPVKVHEAADGEAASSSQPATTSISQPANSGSEQGGKAETAEPTVELLDLRIGRILTVERHPDADSLYVEQIELGEEQPRQVVSGLVKFVPIEDMQNRLVIVVANMKPMKMRGIVSSGMLLCASNAAHDQVDPLIPPEGAAVGERISFEGFNSNEGSPEQLKPKKKVFEKIAPYLKTSSDGIATYKDTPFQTSAGLVKASITSGNIS